MPTIVVDESKFHARTHCDLPKKGEVTAVFLVGNTLRKVTAQNYKTAIDEVKRLYARPMGIFTIVLQNVGLVVYV